VGIKRTERKLSVAALAFPEIVSVIASEQFSAISRKWGQKQTHLSFVRTKMMERCWCQIWNNKSLFNIDRSRLKSTWVDLAFRQDPQNTPIKAPTQFLTHFLERSWGEVIKARPLNPLQYCDNHLKSSTFYILAPPNIFITFTVYILKRFWEEDESTLIQKMNYQIYQSCSNSSKKGTADCLTIDKTWIRHLKQQPR
jgi:hypothetical protein